MGKSSRTILEHYAGADLILPELDMLGFDHHSEASGRLPPHEHPQAFEVCLIVRGKVEWWVGQEVFEVSRGEVFVTHPAERHGGVDAVLHVCELYFFQIALAGRRELPGLTAEESSLLAGRLASLRLRTFPATPEVESGFTRLLACQRQGGVAARIEARAALHLTLIGVLRAHDAALAASRPNVSPEVQQAMKYIGEHLSEDYAVEELAEHVGLSVSRFHERFAQETGLTPADYRARQRVLEAKRLLRQSDMDVTQIAMRLGFSSSQYFATVFRKHTGRSPSGYRALGASADPDPGDDRE